MRSAAAVVGVGELPPQRVTPGATVVSMLGDVGALALADAGLAVRDVDGLVTQAPPLWMGLPALVEILGLDLRFAEVVELGGATAAGMVLRAAMAIASGRCTTCLCLTAAPRDADASTGAAMVGQPGPVAEFEEPYGLVGATPGYALIAHRYMHEYGATPEQLAKIAVDQRANACRTPHAIFHDRPITIDDVLSSPMVADPLHLLEIVMRVGGAAGVVVTEADRGSSLGRQPAYVRGVGERATHWSAAAARSLTTSPIEPASAEAFAMAGLAPGDIGLLSVYDCYTITVLLTLEDAGFCAKGAGGAFVDEHSLRHDGDLPVNTHGGQLSYGQAGLAGGMSHVLEAVRQLQGRADDRQVRDVEHAFVHGNGGIMGQQVSLVLSVAR